MLSVSNFSPQLKNLRSQPNLQKNPQEKLNTNQTKPSFKGLVLTERCLLSRELDGFLNKVNSIIPVPFEKISVDNGYARRNIIIAGTDDAGRDTFMVSNSIVGTEARRNHYAVLKNALDKLNVKYEEMPLGNNFDITKLKEIGRYEHKLLVINYLKAFGFDFDEKVSMKEIIKALDNINPEQLSELKAREFIELSEKPSGKEIYEEINKFLKAYYYYHHSSDAFKTEYGPEIYENLDNYLKAYYSCSKYRSSNFENVLTIVGNNAVGNEGQADLYLSRLDELQNAVIRTIKKRKEYKPREKKVTN